MKMTLIASLIYFIIVFTPQNQAQSRFSWIHHDDGVLDSSPFHTILSKLFALTDNYYGISNALESIDEDQTVKVREDFDAVANKANEFLEQMIEFLDSNSIKRRPKGNFKEEFGKGRPVYEKETLTLGQHVCVREKKIELPHVTPSSGSVCTLYKRATRCVTSNANETLIRIVECCDGYHTNDIKKGCTQYDPPESLDDLLIGKNICSNALEFLKDTKLTTLLIANNGICSLVDDVERKLDEYLLDQPYHSYELINSQKLPTRKPNTFVIVAENTKHTDYSNDKPLLNCVEIAEEDLAWKNGLVQLLSGPLLTTTQTLLDIIANNSDFRIFSDLLTDELRDRLSSNDHISTVFVFNDTTFESLSPSLQARMRQRKGCAKDLIKEHIYDGMLCSKLMEDGVKSISGLRHRFYKHHGENGTEIIRLDNGRILDTDQVASNGVIHLIDDVIFSDQFVDWRDHLELPERDFLDIVERIIGYEDEPVAIFVPPNDSFQNLTDEKSFVLNHIAMGDSHVTDKLISTAYGSKIPASMNSLRPTIGCAKTIKPMMKYCNTTIYLIDSALPIIENSLAELIANRPEFSTFASLLNESNIDLENEGPYTVLLPTNDALSTNQIRELKSNATLAKNFILRHIFEGLMCLKNLLDTKSSIHIPVSLKNLKGEYYNGRTESGRTKIGGANVEDSDMLAINGNLHTLDSPLQWHDQLRHRPLCSIFDLT